LIKVSKWISGRRNTRNLKRSIFYLIKVLCCIVRNVDGTQLFPINIQFVWIVIIGKIRWNRKTLTP
jgi:hypothetical protein